MVVGLKAIATTNYRKKCPGVATKHYLDKSLMQVVTNVLVGLQSSLMADSWKED